MNGDGIRAERIENDKAVPVWRCLEQGEAAVAQNDLAARAAILQIGEVRALDPLVLGVTSIRCYSNLFVNSDPSQYCR